VGLDILDVLKHFLNTFNLLGDIDYISLLLSSEGVQLIDLLLDVASLWAQPLIKLNLWCISDLPFTKGTRTVIITLRERKQ
jgi:hypothetical protein